MKLKIALVLTSMLVLSACANRSALDEQNDSAALNTSEQQSIAEGAPDDSGSSNSVSDPFEPINRVVWDFNYDVLDRFLLKPLTQGYVAVTPRPVRNSLLNASENLEEIANTGNNLLQGKVDGAGKSVGRFLVNSTVGVLGLFDVADSMGLDRQEESFGESLGVWGVGTGPYLMLPALGPSDARSFVGRVVDNLYWPGTVLHDRVVVSAAVIRLLETRASLLEQEENLNRALDQYLFVRDAYFQRLAFEVNDGRIEQKSEEELQQEADDFSDFEALLEGDGGD